MMRVLITGGAGFVGANLTRMLTDRGHSVTVFDLASSAAIAGVNAAFIKGDVRDGQAVDRALARCDVVVHLAALTGVLHSFAHPREHYETNMGGTRNVIDRLEGRQMVLLSSAAADNPDTSPYAGSKAGAEALARYASVFGQACVTSLRPTNIYGPYSTHKTSVVAAFLRQANDGRLLVNGDGSQERDFVHVHDVCTAVLKALGSPACGDVLTVGTGRATSVAELAHMLIARGVGDRVTFTDGDPGVQRSVATHAQLTTTLHAIGWEPSVPLRIGLTHLVRNERPA